MHLHIYMASEIFSQYNGKYSAEGWRGRLHFGAWKMARLAACRALPVSAVVIQDLLDLP